MRVNMDNNYLYVCDDLKRIYDIRYICDCFAKVVAVTADFIEFENGSLVHTIRKSEIWKCKEINYTMALIDCKLSEEDIELVKSVSEKTLIMEG